VGLRRSRLGRVGGSCVEGGSWMMGGAVKFGELCTNRRHVKGMTRSKRRRDALRRGADDDRAEQTNCNHPPRDHERGQGGCELKVSEEESPRRQLENAPPRYPTPKKRGNEFTWRKLGGPVVHTRREKVDGPQREKFRTS